MNFYKYFKNDVKTLYKYKNSLEYIRYIEEENKYRDIMFEEMDYDKEKDDYYFSEDVTFVSYYIYDFLTNDDVAKLIDKIKKLPKDSYEVDCIYKKSTHNVKYNYVQLQYSHTSESKFADINFKNNKYIKQIHISCTQVNNYYMLLEYEFIFTKCFKEEKDLKDFLYSYLNKINKEDYIEFYRIKNKDNIDYDRMCSFERNMLFLVMQHFITSDLYSRTGKYNKLPSLAVYTREKAIDINTFYMKNTFARFYYNVKENYIIESCFDDYNYSMLCGNNSIKSSPLFHFISRFRNEAYYLLFGYNDLRKFEEKYNSFLQGTKHPSIDDELLELLTKVQSISDYRLDDYDALNNEIKENWEVYYDGKKEVIDIKSSLVTRYRKIYNQNLDHIRLKVDIYNTKSNNKISKTALILSIISILITLVVSIAQIVISIMQIPK